MTRNSHRHSHSHASNHRRPRPGPALPCKPNRSRPVHVPPSRFLTRNLPVAHSDVLRRESRPLRHQFSASRRQHTHTHAHTHAHTQRSSQLGTVHALSMHTAWSTDPCTRSGSDRIDAPCILCAVCMHTACIVLAQSMQPACIVHAQSIHTTRRQFRSAISRALLMRVYDCQEGPVQLR